MRKKKWIALGLAACMSASGISVFADYEWAKDAANYCVKSNIILGFEDGSLHLEKNLTREQMAKMLTEAFGIAQVDGTPVFSDVNPGRWSVGYINAFAPYVKKQSNAFEPERQVTREEFVASLVLASGLTEGNIRNRDILEDNFDDAAQVDSEYRTLLCIAVERGYLKGDNGQLRPKDLLTRAEVCTLLQRVIEGKKGTITLDLGVRQSQTSLIGPAQVTLEQAKKWAQDRKADQRYIEIADIYWQYGELTGMRPEILYAQAAKETNFGKYTGAVQPDQNNWAGIKVAGATGDRTEDHETFATPEDGVRGHFNHMSAYVGLAPIGEPHGRYHVVSKIDWAGTVKTLEDLGGKWCPDLYYGYSILHNFIEPMMETK
jgi:hypothetical protein